MYSNFEKEIDYLIESLDKFIYDDEILSEISLSDIKQNVWTGIKKIFAKVSDTFSSISRKLKLKEIYKLPKQQSDDIEKSLQLVQVRTIQGSEELINKYFQLLNSGDTSKEFDDEEVNRNFGGEVYKVKTDLKSEVEKVCTDIEKSIEAVENSSEYKRITENDYQKDNIETVDISNILSDIDSCNKYLNIFTDNLSKLENIKNSDSTDISKYMITFCKKVIKYNKIRLYLLNYFLKSCSKSISLSNNLGKIKEKIIKLKIGREDAEGNAFGLDKEDFSTLVKMRAEFIENNNDQNFDRCKTLYENLCELFNIQKGYIIYLNLRKSTDPEYFGIAEFLWYPNKYDKIPVEGKHLYHHANKQTDITELIPKCAGNDGKTWYPEPRIYVNINIALNRYSKTAGKLYDIDFVKTIRNLSQEELKNKATTMAEKEADSIYELSGSYSTVYKDTEMGGPAAFIISDKPIPAKKVNIDEYKKEVEDMFEESAILESNNDPSYSMYLVSDDYLGDKKQISPKIPRDAFTKKGIKNNEVERVPFYPSIKQALTAAGDGVNEKREMFVHVPVEGQKVKAQKPTSKDVPDIANTGEIWVKEPINVKCIGKIRIGKQLKEVEFEADGKTYHEFTWNYSWLTRQNQNVMNDLSDKDNDTEDISDIKKDKEEDEVEESINYLSEDAVKEFEEALNLGDKLMLFGEDAKYDPQLKRLLYNSRLKQRKEVLEIYDKVKADNKWIRYTFPDLPKYQHRNMFVDTYFYTQIFFANNTWQLKKGLGLYLDFMSRLLHNPNIDNAGYKRKTIMIPVLDWDAHHDGTVWNYKISLNPISAMYQLMFTMDIRTLKKIFGDTDILFVGNTRFFKMNFNDIPDKEAKKYASKFRIFLTKLCKNEQFDPEDIDTEGEFTDSPEVVKAKIADKIEDVKGVDITPELYKATKKEEELERAAKAGKSLRDTTHRLTKADKDKAAKEEEIADKNLTKAAQSKSDKDKIKDENQIKKDNIAQNIAYRLQCQPGTQEDDIFGDIPDSVKLDLLTLEPDDDTVNVSAARAVRMSELDRKVLETRVKGKTVEDILGNNINKEVVKTKLDISDPLNEYSELTFMNFDKNYDIDKDIIACFRHFANTSIPVAIRDISVTDNSTSEDRVELYKVEMESYNGGRFTIKLDIPIEKDNRYLLRGNTKSIQTQLYTMPILKVDLDSAQVVSNYSKIIINRFKSGNGRSLPMTAKLMKAINKYKGSKIKFVTGDNSKVCNKYDLPIDYIDLATSLSKIETKTFIFYFNQDEIRELYEIDESQGIPVAYAKDTKSILYLSYVQNEDFTYMLYRLIGEDDKEFLDLWNSMAKPSACTYSRAKVMSTEIPLVVICGYHEGLRASLDKGAIEYRIENSLSKEIKNDIEWDWIKFSDGYICFKATQEASLFMNGLKDCDTASHSISEIDDKNMYYEFLDNFGGRIKADGLDNFYDLMMDPMTVESLKYYHLPTDYIQVLIYANNLLADNKYIRHTETDTKRFRRKQLIAVYTYKVLSSAYSSYAYQVKNGAIKAARMMVKQSDVIDAFLSDSITSDDSTINALRDIETTNSVTTKGPSGMNSQRAYSLDKRTYDDSMLNVFGISTGFASNVGITRQATLNSNVTPEGYTKVINGDTSKMNTVNTLTATEALTPFGSTHDDPMRTAMTFIQTSKHQVRTVDSDPALVTNGADEAMPYMSSDRFAFKAKQDGKIIDLTDDYVLIQYKDGTKDFVNLREIIDKNSDGGYYVPLKLDINKGIKIGKNIKANDIIAYDKESYSDNLGETGNLAYNIGKLAKVAIINSDEGFEDSGVITESLAKKLATRVDYQFSVILDKDSIVYNMVKVGQHVEAGESLLTYQRPFEDEDANSIMKSLSVNADEVSDLGKKELDCEVTGTVKGIKIFRTVELDELSDSLRKIVDDYERPLRKMEKVIRDNNLDISQVPAHYKLDTVGKLKKAEDAVLIEIYVEYLDTVGIGDKIVAYSANKMVIKDIIPQELAPYTDSRPNEKIDAFISESSIDKRIISSTLIFGALSHLMVELDRSVKDIMGIKYDDSTM